jgi:hypothetical protein
MSINPFQPHYNSYIPPIIDSSSINQINKFDLEDHPLSIEEFIEEFEKMSLSLKKTIHDKGLLNIYDIFDESFLLDWQEIQEELKSLGTQALPEQLPLREISQDLNINGSSNSQVLLDSSSFYREGSNALLRYCTHKKLQDYLLNHCKSIIDSMHSEFKKSFVFSVEDSIQVDEYVAKLDHLPDRYNRESFEIFNFIYMTYKNLMNSIEKYQKDNLRSTPHSDSEFDISHGAGGGGTPHAVSKFIDDGRGFDQRQMEIAIEASLNTL